MQWFSANKEPITWQVLINKILLLVNKGIEHKIAIGTDSQKISNKTIFVVAICILSEEATLTNKYFYTKILDQNNYPLYSRVQREVQLSVDTANTIRKNFTRLDDGPTISIHIDISSEDQGAKTSKYSRGLISFVKAHNYINVEVKPKSWAASAVADRLTK